MYVLIDLTRTKGSDNLVFWNENLFGYTEYLDCAFVCTKEALSDLDYDVKDTLVAYKPMVEHFVNKSTLTVPLIALNLFKN